MKTIEEHNKEVFEIINTNSVGTGIECPKCKSEMVNDTDFAGMSLLTDPPRKDICCESCGFKTSVFT